MYVCLWVFLCVPMCVFVCSFFVCLIACAQLCVDFCTFLFVYVLCVCVCQYVCIHIWNIESNYNLSLKVSNENIWRKCRRGRGERISEFIPCLLTMPFPCSFPPPPSPFFNKALKKAKWKGGRGRIILTIQKEKNRNLIIDVHLPWIS